MFGNNDQQDQQQDGGNDGFGTPMPASPVADGSLSSDNPTNGNAHDNNGFLQDVSAPAVSQNGDNSLTGTATSGNADDLLSIKQGALQQLSPLVGHLDQTPEEKFRTTMMMIQASDDQSLIKTAYEAAQKIGDDKARAQALLDVINEINYFTQQHNK